MGEVIRLSDYHYPWTKIFADDSGDSTLEIYTNTGTGQLEVLIYNDEGECCRKVLTTVESVNLYRVIGEAHRKVGR